METWEVITTEHLHNMGKNSIVKSYSPALAVNKIYGIIEMDSENLVAIAVVENKIEYFKTSSLLNGYWYLNMGEFM